MQRASPASAATAGGDSQRVSKTDEVADVDILQTSPAPGAAAAIITVPNPSITPQAPAAAASPAVSPLTTGGSSQTGSSAAAAAASVLVVSKAAVVSSPSGSIGSPVITSSTSVSPSGGTIHHHGQSPTRGGVLPPLANSQQQINSNMSQQSSVPQQAPTSGQKVAQRRASGSSSAPASPGASTSSAISRVLFESPKSTGPSPRKKARTEELPPATQDIANYRKQIVELKLRSMSALKAAYSEHLTELFFLQNGGNLMDYAAWLKRPSPQLLHYIKSGALDSDDEEEMGPERKINNEVTVLTSGGSNMPIATPVAICKELPASVTALVQQSAESKKLPSGGRHGMVFGHVQPSQQGTPSVSKPGGFPITPGTSLPITPTTVTAVSSVCTATTSVTMTTSQSVLSTAASTSHMHLLKSLSSTTLSSSPAQHGSGLVPKVQKSGLSSQRPFVKQTHLPQSISDVYDTDVGSQEAIVERAKQEAQVMHRVAELRKEGLWTSRRLPKVQEPPRNKAQWDYLLEEMTWLAADFAQERKKKKAAARKVARMVQKHFLELEQKELRAEKEEAQKLRKIASQIAKQVKEFWSNIEKVVQYKMQTRQEEKRKKALDLHLNFIVDQTEKYSTWLTEGLQTSRPGSLGDASSLAGSLQQDHSAASGDEDFEPDASDADDEETIEEAEKDGHDQLQTEEELAALQQESELPIEELLRSFTHPLSPSDLNQSQDDDESMEVDSTPEKSVTEDGKEKDSDFVVGADEEVEDIEVTIEEQEKRENSKDTNTEISELQEEGEMTIEELMKRYAGAYDSDFEYPQDSSGEDDDADDDGSESDNEHEDTEEETLDGENEEEEEDDEDTRDADVVDVGLDYLMNPDERKSPVEKKEVDESGPGREITDIAAEALSLQPKGYTLQTAEVKTSVPFLLKHILREYQHVGLDWLATMNEKRLNGILADEMGLGKTIQTIAMLAHLACEKGIWGPHLIVVPTSVMLNWELELKKWCPAFKILTYYGSIKERKLKRQGWTKTNAFHVCITSYKLVIQDHQSFRRKKKKVPTATLR